MRAHYEELWARLPDREPEAFAARRALLLSRVRPGERVLDVGCGLGHFTAALAAAGARPVGVDLAHAAVARARRAHPGLDLRALADDGTLPLGDGEVDLVWAGEVIEHVADTAAWLSDVRRVLRTGGRLLVTTPAHGRVRAAALALTRFEAHWDPLGDHLRFYSPRSLRDVLEAFGFEDVRLGGLGGPPGLRRTLVGEGVRAGFRVA